MTKYTYFFSLFQFHWNISRSSSSSLFLFFFFFQFLFFVSTQSCFFFLFNKIENLRKNCHISFTLFELLWVALLLFWEDICMRRRLKWLFLRRTYNKSFLKEGLNCLHIFPNFSESARNNFTFLYRKLKLFYWWHFKINFGCYLFTF